MVTNFSNEHLDITVEGFVQGVGMRPFVALLAKQYGQTGWVANTAEGLAIAIEGNPDLQQQFLHHLNHHAPSPAGIASLTISKQALENYCDFQIKPSRNEGIPSAFVLPDIATCQKCIKEVFNPDSRFYRYPFTSCSQCGPRYSIMHSLPYDRQTTVMAQFSLCRHCEHDYQSPDNRRFHAQTLACPDCGPTLSLLDSGENRRIVNEDALVAASDYLRAGKVVAVKGIGGFQLWVDATNQAAVERLRSRKQRPHKPFALMVADLLAAQRLCDMNGLEQQALVSYAAPIVLLKKMEGSQIADAVAPGTRLLGLMLACSPLHHLLLQEFGSPVVATSGNRQDEPICIDNDQAVERLTGIADCFLMHNRPILRPLDDSIVRQIGNTMTVLRRARGYAPMPVSLKVALPDLLAVGGHLKNTVAVCHDKQLILSQHIADLACEASQKQFKTTLTEFQQFYQIKPIKVMRDLHEDYASSQLVNRIANQVTNQEYGRLSSLVKVKKVQHHYAHILSCMAEHGLEPPLLGVAWDGNGLGNDNTLWGGEFLFVHDKGFRRFGHLRPFALPGGTKAMQEPRRSALGLLYGIYGEHCFISNKLPFSEQELNLIRMALTKQLNCPLTTSAGRLFDAIASLLGLCQVNQYEGHAAMMLENCAAEIKCEESYGFTMLAREPLVIDWQIAVEQLLADIQHETIGHIAKKFHNTLAEMILSVANRAGEQNIVLSGGCFQNACLVERTVGQLKAAGFKVYCHELIPPNDGGLALGQLYAAKYLG